MSGKIKSNDLTPSQVGFRSSPQSSISFKMTSSTPFSFSLLVCRSASRFISPGPDDARLTGPSGTSPPSATSSSPCSSTPYETAQAYRMWQRIAPAGPMEAAQGSRALKYRLTNLTGSRSGPNQQGVLVMFRMTHKEHTLNLPPTEKRRLEEGLGEIGNGLYLFSLDR